MQTNLIFTSHSMDHRSSISFSIYISHFLSLFSWHNVKNYTQKIPFLHHPPVTMMFIYISLSVFFFLFHAPARNWNGAKKKAKAWWRLNVKSFCLEKNSEAFSSLMQFPGKFSTFQSFKFKHENKNKNIFLPYLAVLLRGLWWNEKAAPARRKEEKLRWKYANGKSIFRLPVVRFSHFLLVRKHPLRVFSVIGKDVVITRRWKKLFREEKRDKISYHLSNISENKFKGVSRQKKVKLILLVQSVCVKWFG